MVTLFSGATKHTSIDEHSNHLTVRDSVGALCVFLKHCVCCTQPDKLTGAPLTLCTFQAGMQDELLDFGQDMQLEIGLTRARLQAVQTTVTLRCEKIGRTSWNVHRSILHLVLFGREVVGMHVELALL